MALIKDYYIQYFRPYLLLIYHYTLSVPGYGNSLSRFQGIRGVSGKFYYYADQTISFFLPFVLLLVMNSVIIHTLRKRSKFSLARLNTQNQNQVQNQVEGRNTKLKSEEKHIIIMLLLVTFCYLILTSPAHGSMIFTSYINFTSSPKMFAGFTQLWVK